MLDSLIRLVIGDRAEKRAYRAMMKRVSALPKDYRFAFRKIRQYMYTVGPPDGDMTVFTDLTLFSDLVDLFEASAAGGRQVLDVIGRDVGRFSDEFMRASAADAQTPRKRLNDEIADRFNKDGR